jgi:hypothetical protein
MMMFQEDEDKGSKKAAARVNPAAEQYLGKVDELAMTLQDKLLSLDVSGLFDEIGKGLDLFSPKNLAGKFRYLDEEAAVIRNSLGLGVEKSKQLSLMVADNIARFAELGYGAQDVGDTMVKVISAYGANIAFTNEDLLTLKATAEVTDTRIETLAVNFKNVGIGVRQVGDRMVEVTEIARNAGVSVAAVAEGVVTNLDKMNLYNFEGGVKGLAKMSAQATRLGIDMKSIFNLVEKVFNPEGAIELASAMQRLGVQTNALLDPLRLMDLSQNDPTELQNQIVNMSKDFVRFNKELGQFEILPGEKRRLNEIGKAMGLANGELQKMAINAATLDMKMKQIKFPSSIATKEDRELIATLATVNEKGIAQVRVKEIDERTGEWTGKDTMKDVSQLTARDIKELKEGQELQGKSMEDIAKEQLSEATRLNAQVAQLIRAVEFGVASSEAGSRVYEFRTKTMRETFFQEKGREGGAISEGARRTQTYRSGTNDLTNQLGSVIQSAIEGLKASGSLDEMKSIYNSASQSIESMFNSFKNINFSNLIDFGGIVDKIGSVAESFGIGGSETDPGSKFVNNQTNTTIARTNVQNLNTIATPNTIEVKPIDINEKLDVNITVNLDPSIKDQRLTDIATAAVNKWFTGGDSAAHIEIITNALAEKISQNSMVAANVEKRGFVQTPGMG